MIKAKNPYRKQYAFQLFSKNYGITISRRKECIISVKIFSCHAAIGQIAMFNETVKPIYIIQMIKALFTIIVIIAVFNSAVGKGRKNIITPESIAEYKCSISNMVFKY